MNTITQNNKRIAKNTLYLYIRMLLVMGVTLFTSRIVLKALGEEDYGIYNVIGGVVTMLTFFNSTMTSTCQRYFSYHIGKNDLEELDRMFKLNMSVFLLFGLVVFVLAETIGLWFINTQMTIPVERMVAMNWVYQCSILSFFCAIIQVPYNALIISHERMSAFAYISVVEVLLKLFMAISLLYIDVDKLILYAILMLLCHALIAMYYCYYCIRRFKECKFGLYWNKNRFIEVFSYSSWHLLGALSVTVRNQGVNILLNIFFNPIVNAGRAIAYQVTSAVDSLANNFFVASKPQIYKYYAQGNLKEMHLLIIRSTKVCFYLIAVIAIPVIVNTREILGLWLEDVPTYAVLFTQLSLVNAMIDSTNGPAIASALATARIRNFEIITGGLMILNLPISYLVLKFGGNPELTIIVSIMISLVTIVVRAVLLNQLIKLPMKRYLVNTCFPFIFVALLSWIFSQILVQSMEHTLPIVFITSFVSAVITSILFYILSLDGGERQAIVHIIYNRLHIRKHE